MRTKVITATFLFTDLVGSTELLERLGDDENDLVRRQHFQTLRGVARRFHGEVVKNLGDGVMVAFSSAHDAVAAAIAMQHAVRDDARDKDVELSIRVGLHVGEVVREEGDYFGTPVVVAKRICDKADGGQILISETIADVVGTRGRYRLSDYGAVALKGLQTPLPLRVVEWETEEERAARGGDQVTVGDRIKRAWPLIAAGVLLASAAAFAAFRSGDPDAPGVRAPVELTWTKVDGGEAFGGPGEDKSQAVTRLTEGGPGLVAVGYEEDLPAVDPVAWYSLAGRVWSRAKIDEKDSIVKGLHEQRMWGVAKATIDGEEVLVAVGQDGSIRNADVAVWTSDNGGREWKRVPHDEAVFGGRGDQVMARVVPGGPGFIAVGYAAQRRDVDAAVWSSADGVEWSRIEDNTALWGGPGDQHIRSITPIENGNLIAVGYDSSGGDQDAAVWRFDGIGDWSRVEAGEEVFGGEGDQLMTTVTYAEDVRFPIVAVGNDSFGGTNAAVWVSKDGSEWLRPPGDDFNLEGAQQMYGVAADDNTLFAVGSDNRAGAGADSVVWTSTDGIDWTQVIPESEQVFGGEGNQYMRSLTPFRGGVVGVGSESTGPDNEYDAAVWLARPSDD